MARFESEQVSIPAPAATVFDFLSDFRNFQNLMPSQISNWKADADTCSFTIEGLAGLSMRIASRAPHTNVHIVSEGKNPVAYTLDCFLKPDGNDRCKASLEFDAALNPFMEMVASRPLQNFVNMLAEKLQQHFKQTSE
jgi:carbon monoxide dehydrogenase subunit G